MLLLQTDDNRKPANKHKLTKQRHRPCCQTQTKQCHVMHHSKKGGKGNVHLPWRCEAVMPEWTPCDEPLQSQAAGVNLWLKANVHPQGHIFRLLAGWIRSVKDNMTTYLSMLQPIMLTGVRLLPVQTANKTTPLHMKDNRRNKHPADKHNAGKEPQNKASAAMLWST